MAAGDADEATKTRVADFLFRRAEIDYDIEPAGENWCPFMALADAMAFLGDDRLVPVIEGHLAGSQSHYIEIMLRESLKSFTYPADNWEANWRLGYPERCAEWAEYCWDDEDKLPHDEGGWNVAHDRATEVAERLGRDFGRSRFADDIADYRPEDAGIDIAEWLKSAWEYTGQSPDRLRLGTTREMLYDWMPRKYSFDREYFENFPLILEAFFRFLEDQGRLPQAEAFRHLAREARTKLPALANDPSNWGMAKSFVMMGEQAGFDMQTQEGLNEFMLAYNAQQFSRHTEPRQSLTPWQYDEQEDFEAKTIPFPLPKETVRRDAPRVGRNDLCPCGSGKKYKKCCGRD